MSVTSRLQSSKYLVIAALGIGGYLVATGAIPFLHKPGAAPVNKSEGQDLLAAAVSVVAAKPADFVEQVVITGSLVAREEILVGPEVEGLRIVEVLADEGDKVVKGQVLARLVTDTLDAQLAQNDAALAKATAAIAQANSNLVSAQAKLVEARNAYDRSKPLRQSGIISEAVQDTRESAAKVAESALLAARDAIAAAEADKKQIEAQRRELNWKRGRTEVIAPDTGIVSRRVARVGGYAAGAADPMFRIVARNEVELEAEVLDSQIARIREGQTATIALAGGGEVKGKVRIVSPEIDKTTRLGRVRVFLGENDRLRIGGFARGGVVTAESRGLAVPASAILYGDGGASVQLVVDNRIVARPVKLGLTSGAETEVRAGLSEGDIVVARAGSFLREGDAVRPIRKAAKLSENVR